MGILFLFPVIFWKKGGMAMKKFGVLLCLLLGLTGCGQEMPQEPDFATLDEAIEAHLQKNPGSELEEVGQIENAHIAAFSESGAYNSVEDGEASFRGVPVYFVLYEEAEGGFILQEETAGMLLDETGAPMWVLGEANWITHEDGIDVQYHLRGVGFGETSPTVDELDALDGFSLSEVHERDGFYFAFALEIDEHEK